MVPKTGQFYIRVPVPKTGQFYIRVPVPIRLNEGDFDRTCLKVALRTKMVLDCQAIQLAVDQTTCIVLTATFQSRSMTNPLRSGRNSRNLFFDLVSLSNPYGSLLAISMAHHENFVLYKSDHDHLLIVYLELLKLFKGRESTSTLFLVATGILPKGKKLSLTFGRPGLLRNPQQQQATCSFTEWVYWLDHFLRNGLLQKMALEPSQRFKALTKRGAFKIDPLREEKIQCANAAIENMLS